MRELLDELLGVFELDIGSQDQRRHDELLRSDKGGEERVNERESESEHDHNDRERGLYSRRSQL